MKPKHVLWYIASDKSVFLEHRPTRYSADRLAQRNANETGHLFYYYTAKNRRKAGKRKKSMKTFLVYPESV